MSDSTEPASSVVDPDGSRPQYASRRERREAEAAGRGAAATVPPSDTSVSARAVVSAPAPAVLSAPAVASTPAVVLPAATAPRRRLLPSFASLRRTVVAGGVMALVVGLAVGTTVPSSALKVTATSATAEPEPLPTVAAQRVEIAVEPVTSASGAVERDAWTGGSTAALQMAAYQASGFGYAPGYIPTSGSIRWPFPYSTSMSSGFGEYRGDSTHNGLDFNPGIGSPIQAIADGVVTWVGWKSNYGFGYFATVEHVIDGVAVESLYAHMIDGSSPLVIGQTVSVGDEIGLVGNTGYSTGPHLHLEIRVEGTPVDPYAWLTEHATNR